MRAAGGTASPADFPENRTQGNRGEREQGNPSARLNAFGAVSFWHRSLPQEAAKVPCVDFFFPFSLCDQSESGGIWQLLSISTIVIPW